MWWRDQTLTNSQGAVLRGLSAALCALALAGCFQPLYGERTLSGDSTLRQRMGAVEVEPIRAPQGSPEARIAVELRNALIFELTG
jgi:LPS-assembly lipoprotein